MNYFLCFLGSFSIRFLPIIIQRPFSELQDLFSRKNLTASFQKKPPFLFCNATTFAKFLYVTGFAHSTFSKFLATLNGLISHYHQSVAHLSPRGCSLSVCRRRGGSIFNFRAERRVLMLFFRRGAPEIRFCRAEGAALENFWEVFKKLSNKSAVKSDFFFKKKQAPNYSQK